MVIKKNIRCRKCKEWITICAEQRMPYKGLTLKCKCDHKQKCIKEEVGLTKWEDIENE